MSKFEKLFSRLVEHHGEEARDPKKKKLFDGTLGSFLTKLGEDNPLYGQIEKAVEGMTESDSESVEESTMHRAAARFGSFRDKATKDWPAPDTVKFRIVKNDLGEYVVKVYINGKYQESPTYYTNDLEDAKNTLLAMKKEYMEKGYNILESTLTEGRKKYGKVNPWAVCTKSVGRDDKKKYEKCVKKVKKSHEVSK